MAKILNAETMRKNLVGKVRNVRIYGQDAKIDLSTSHSTVAHSETIKVSGETWLGSAAREKLLNERKNLETKVQQQLNAATGYDWKTIQALAGLYTIDLTRQADEYPDYTPVMCKEIVNEEFPESVNLRDELPYIGKEEDMQGSGDTVPLMHPALPTDKVVTLKIRGFGDKTSYRQLVFNPFHSTEKILTSAARILSDEKNKDSFGPILGADFSSAGHKQAADVAGATYDLQVYNTLKSGIKKALNLICEPLNKQNGLLRHEIYLLVNPMDLVDIQPIISGALASVGGLQQLAPALPIDGVVPYGGGLNHGMKYGEETLSYPGVPQGKVYILVKIDSFGGYRLVKRNETMEVGEGDVLALSTEKRAWHRIRGMFLDFILPKSTGGKDYGALVEVTLSEFS